MPKLSELQLIGLRAAGRGEQPRDAIERAARLVGRNEPQRTGSRLETMMLNRGLLRRAADDYHKVLLTDAGCMVLGEPVEGDTTPAPKAQRCGGCGRPFADHRTSEIDACRLMAQRAGKPFIERTT